MTTLLTALNDISVRLRRQAQQIALEGDEQPAGPVRERKYTISATLHTVASQFQDYVHAEREKAKQEAINTTRQKESKQ